MALLFLNKYRELIKTAGKRYKMRFPAADRLSGYQKRNGAFTEHQSMRVSLLL